jgi:cellulose synthase (UDP-forming)
MFLIYLALTLAGIIAAFIVDDGRSLQESSALALFWSWYNIVLLSVACMVCIEQPRKRKAERFDARDQAIITLNGQIHSHPVLDISRTGMRLAGLAPAPQGARIDLKLGDMLVGATVVRVAQNEFAVIVEDTLAARKAMIQQVYCGRYSAAIEQISGRAVFSAVLARLFR